MTARTRTVLYWATTIFVVFNIFSGGLAELLQLQGNIEGMQALGYPLYVMTILGTWKVLGSIALLAPRFPRLKEWAYAGIFFNMTGAAISHLVVGDAAWHVYYTASIAIVALVSSPMVTGILRIRLALSISFSLFNLSVSEAFFAFSA